MDVKCEHGGKTLPTVTKFLKVTQSLLKLSDEFSVTNLTNVYQKLSKKKNDTLICYFKAFQVQPWT